MELFQLAQETRPAEGERPASAGGCHGRIRELSVVMKNRAGALQKISQSKDTDETRIPSNSPANVARRGDLLIVDCCGEQSAEIVTFERSAGRGDCRWGSLDAVTRNILGGRMGSTSL